VGADVKIAILSDIHGNLRALEAVVADMPSIDMILCCGDMVGYYPDVNEVCALLRDMNALAVRGNHDAYLIGELHFDSTKASAYRPEWARERLASNNLQWLKALPIEMRFSWDSLILTMRHASPWDEEMYLYADSPCLSEIRLQLNEMLVIGHTHHPMMKNVGDGIVLNPGSVGQPRDGNPEASYAILETGNKYTQMRRVPYDVHAFQEHLEALGWDEATISILNREGYGR